MPRAKKTGKPNNSPYSVFFKRELKRIKLENPSIPHKEAFKQAGLNWRTSPENPKNKPAVATVAAQKPVPGVTASEPKQQEQQEQHQHQSNVGDSHTNTLTSTTKQPTPITTTATTTTTTTTTVALPSMAAHAVTGAIAAK